jgi:hypothetical protein
MKIRILLLLLSVAILDGCSATARLYPVQGPLSTQTPLPVFLAKMTGKPNSGTITAMLNSGEACKGHWQVIPRAKAAKGATTATYPSDNNMSAEWDAVYGTGFYVAHVLGQKLYVRTVLTGNQGTVLNAEMYRPDTHDDVALGSIKGVAKDNKNNLYKIAF